MVMAPVVLALLLPACALAWGPNAQRLIATRAVDTLPPDLRPFFEANRDFIIRHSTDPLTLLKQNPTAELKNHVLYLDHYGKFPFDALPRTYTRAVGKFGRTKLEANGVLPWQIGVYSQKLTEAMRTGNWDQARTAAAMLAGYVAESNDPFNTTENFDGHLSDLVKAWWTDIRCFFPCVPTTPPTSPTPPTTLSRLASTRTPGSKIFFLPTAVRAPVCPTTRTTITTASTIRRERCWCAN
jgi:hypothetical protein